MKTITLAASIALALAGSTSAQSVVIDFDGLASSTVVTNQYPEATFSSSAGNQNTAFISPSAHSIANILCSGSTSAGIDCLQDTYIDFTNPVKNLTFWAIEANVAGVTAQFNVFESGSLSATVDLLVPVGGAGNNEFVDLSAFTNVTRLEIVNILNDPNNENGIGWDTFSFRVVPTPGTAVLAGFGALGLMSRRRS